MSIEHGGRHCHYCGTTIAPDNGGQCQECGRNFDGRDSAETDAKIKELLDKERSREAA